MSKTLENIRYAVVQPLNGGMPIGYEESIGKPPVYIISNNDANDTHYINYMNVVRKLNIPVINMSWDLKEYNTKEDEELFNEVNKDIDIVCYVPVCAGLSRLSSTAENCPENSKNKNMYDLSSFILKNINPKVACFENAPAAYTKLGELVLDNLKNLASNYNYSTTIERVDTFNHGIPQHRMRTFLYFWNSDKASYIEFQNIKSPLLKDYLDEIPKSATLQEIYPQGKNFFKDFTHEFLMHKYAKNGETIMDIFNKYAPDVNTNTGLTIIKLLDDFKESAEYFKEKAESLDPESKDYSDAIKYHNRLLHCASKLAKGEGYWDDTVASYYVGDCVLALTNKQLNKIVHPTEDRSFNLREIQYLMGLPHDYEILEPTKRKTQNHITQSVPVKTAKHSADQCRDYVLGKLISSNSPFIKQNNVTKKVDYEEPILKEIDISEW